MEWKDRQTDRHRKTIQAFPFASCSGLTDMDSLDYRGPPDSASVSSFTHYMPATWRRSTLPHTLVSVVGKKQQMELDAGDAVAVSDSLAPGRDRKVAEAS